MRFLPKALRSRFAIGIALLGVAGPAAAQTTGKIEGRVIDAQTRQPLAGAQVIVVGIPGLGNLTNADGYYFINNVPAGQRDVQAIYIGYQTVTVQSERVLAGQTMTVNFELPPQAVALEAITVRGEANPLVPRDKTVSKAIVTGDVVEEVPVDNLRAVVTLQPGVVETGDFRGQVIRGGRPGEASVYVDGVLVRSFNRGAQSILELGTNAVEEVNLLTGGYGAEFGSAQSGVINYVTKTGSNQYSGAIGFGTDEIMPSDMNYGNSRLQASFGGPLGGELASFHLALTAEGAEDSDPRFMDDIVAPGGYPVQQKFFRPSGTATFTDSQGNPILDSNGNPITYTTYEEISGLGNRRPYAHGDNYSLSGTLRFNPLTNTKLSLTAVQSRNQGLGFSNSLQFRPKAIPAFVNKSRLFRLGVDQILFQTAESQANLKVNIAYGEDDSRFGQRADTMSTLPEEPDFLGFKFSDYEFLFHDKFTVDAWLARFDSIQAGLATQPLLPAEVIGLDAAEAEDRFGLQFGADTPYGILGTGGHRTAGLSSYRLSNEKTFSIDADLDWQLNRVHRVGAGVEFYNKEIENVSSTGFGSIRVEDTFFQNIYRVKPTIGAFYLKDRMDIGELVLDVGVRMDFFDSDAMYPVIPGLVHPFVPDPGKEAEQCAAPPSGGNPNCLPKFVEQERISTWSPRLGVAFPISDATSFRLSYGHFFQLPQFTDLFNAINADIRRTNTNTAYGRPIEAMKAVQFEAGVSHLINPETVLDITAYNKDKLADAAYRIETVAWPASARGSQDARLLTNLDFGNARGVDVRLTRRVGDYFTTILGYGYLNAKGTGSDPFSYINSFGRFTDPVTGAPLSPAQALQYADFDQRHKFSLLGTANFDEEVAEGTWANALLRNTDISFTAIAGSGLPWTRSSTPGASGRGASGGRFTELINSSRMPWTWSADAKVTRGLNIGGTEIAAFVDVRNLFNTRNQLDVFGFTGSPLDPGDIEAQAGNAVGDDVVLDAVSNPTLRLQYQRQQDLLSAYGLADDDPGLFTSEEQFDARALAYIHSYRLETSFGAPRRIRVGFEWVF